MTLELSSVDKVIGYLQIEDLEPEDMADLLECVEAAREHITRRCKPASRLPDPLPASLHRAATIKAAELFGDKAARYGVSSVLDTGPEGGIPPRIQVMELIKDYRRMPAGAGPEVTDTIIGIP